MSLDALSAVLAQSTVSEPNLVLVAVAVLVTLGAAAALGFIYLTSRPNRPVAGQATMDLGHETPAVVDLLLGGFQVEDDAVIATVVDLAARRQFSIEEVAGGNVIIRLRRERQPIELTRYEQRVMSHIESRAVDGVVPAAALTTGTEGVAQRWFRRFSHDVYAHARELGLCYRRFDLKRIVVAWVVVAAAWVTALLASSFTSDSTENIGEPSLANLVLGMCFVANLGLAWVAGHFTRSDAHRDTPAGLEAAGRWLGVQEYFGVQESFAEAPAASVVIWDRNLAYATAMGLAPVVQRQLPFDTESDQQAWSQVTGHWRRVKVRYYSLRPGWGEHPLKLVFVGLIQGAFFGLIAWLGWQLANEGLDIDEITGDQQRILGLIGLAVASLAAVAVLYAAVRVVLGIIELFPRRTVEGDLLRRRELRTGHRLPKWLQWLIWERRTLQRRYRSGGIGSVARNHNRPDDHYRDQRRRRRYLAIDDGTESTITAYRVSPKIYRQVAQGAKVRLRVSPIIGYVSKIEQLSAPPASQTAAAHGLIEDLGVHAGGLVAALGSQLSKVTGAAEGVTDEHGRPVLDIPDEQGITPRQRLAEAQQQMAEVSPDAAPPAGAPDAPTSAHQGAAGQPATARGATDSPADAGSQPATRPPASQASGPFGGLGGGSGVDQMIGGLFGAVQGAVDKFTESAAAAGSNAPPPPVSAAPEAAAPPPPAPAVPEAAAPPPPAPAVPEAAAPPPPAPAVPEAEMPDPAPEAEPPAGAPSRPAWLDESTQPPPPGQG